MNTPDPELATSDARTPATPQVRPLPAADLERVAAERAFFDTFGQAPLPPGTSVGTTTLGDVPTTVVRPEGPSKGALLYLHGGGYVIGSAASLTPLAAGLAARSGLTAYLPDYRLAPEHQLPAAGADGLAAYRALAELVDPTALVVAGDSAGAGLALSTLVAARDRGLPLPRAMLAFSGWFDLTLSGASLTAKEAVDPIFDAADLRWYADLALAGHDARDPLVSPVLADLRGLPPLLLQVGTHEILLDDTTSLAARAAGQDVAVTLEVHPGQSHVFQHGAVAASPDPVAVGAVDAAAAFVRRAVGAAVRE